jgi:hypothetical protein
MSGKAWRNNWGKVIKVKTHEKDVAVVYKGEEHFQTKWIFPDPTIRSSALQS